MLKQAVLLAFGLVFFFCLFTIIEKIFAGIKNKKVFRRGFKLDVLYFFLIPLIFKPTVKACTILMIVPAYYLLLGQMPTKELIMAGHGSISELPAWGQYIIAICLFDFIGYWMHRWFHKGRQWKIHAIHHCSKDLDWLSSIRLHPLNELITNICRATPIILLGFSPAVVAISPFFFALYAVLLHANVNWSFGPFKTVIASPVFHRWHHSKHKDAIDKNFAGLFPIFDILFGTYYMPKDVSPHNFGIHDKIPENFLKHMVYPFKR